MGTAITFSEKGNGLLTEEDSQQCAAYVDRPGETVPARIGYDLFAEVRTLLTEGQPAANANMPALELHIAFLRDLITGCGVPLVEIPPVPDGYRFIACLTHDVDHPSIRQHKWDHTMFGPGCPAERAESIARHTSLRGSGRVGRSAAGRSLDEKAVTLAVVASIRHEDTLYDSLLMSGVPRAEARDQVRPEIDRALDAWGSLRPRH